MLRGRLCSWRSLPWILLSWITWSTATGTWLLLGWRRTSYLLQSSSAARRTLAVLPRWFRIFQDMILRFRDLR